MYKLLTTKMFSQEVEFAFSGHLFANLPNGFYISFENTTCGCTVRLFIVVQVERAVSTT